VGKGKRTFHRGGGGEKKGRGVAVQGRYPKTKKKNKT